MSHFANLAFSMEEGQVVEGAVVPEVELAATADAAVIADSANEIAQDTAAMEEAIAATVAIDQQAQILEEGVQSGEGVPETTAQAIDVAVEAYAIRLGIKRHGKFSRENFGSKQGRVAATSLALENIGDTLKQLFERIKAIALRIWDKIKTFVMNLFKSTDSMSKHLEALKDRAMKLDDTLKADGDLENEAIAKGVSVKKQASLDTAKVILANSTKLLALNYVLTSEITANAETFKTFVGKDEVTEVEYAGTVSKFTDVVTGRIDAALTAITGEGGFASAAKADKKSKVSYHGPFAGCRVLAVKNETTEVGGENVRTYSLGMTVNDSIAAKKAKTLNKSECVELLTAAIKLLDDLDAHKKSQEKVAKLNDVVKSASDVAIKELGKLADDSTTKGRLFRQMSRDLSGINNTVSALGVSIPNTVYAAVKASADYASASMANLKKK